MADDSAPPRRAARFFQNIGMMVSSVLVFLLLGECGTRAVDRVFNDVPFFSGDEYTELYVEHPFLMRVPRPGAHFQVYSVNRHGFRGRELELPKPAGVYRILTLGGSAAWDTNVSDTDHTWAAQLEDRLNAEMRRRGRTRRFEVVNGGVPGYNSAESLTNFIWRGIPIDPDAVLVYQGYNDFKPNRYPGFRSDYSHWRARDHSVMRLLAQRFRLLHHLNGLLSRFHAYRGERFDTVAQPGLDAFRDNLRRIIVLARDRGIEPMLATYAMSVTEANRTAHPEKFRSLEKYLPTLTFAGVIDAHRRYNQVVVDLGRVLDVPVADVSAGVPADFEHFSDHCHFADPGAARAAEVMAEMILARLAR